MEDKNIWEAETLPNVKFSKNSANLLYFKKHKRIRVELLSIK